MTTLLITITGIVVLVLVYYFVLWCLREQRRDKAAKAIAAKFPTSLVEGDTRPDDAPDVHVHNGDHDGEHVDEITHGDAWAEEDDVLFSAPPTESPALPLRCGPSPDPAATHGLQPAITMVGPRPRWK